MKKEQIQQLANVVQAQSVSMAELHKMMNEAIEQSIGRTSIFRVEREKLPDTVKELKELEKKFTEIKKDEFTIISYKELEDEAIIKLGYIFFTYCLKNSSKELQLKLFEGAIYSI
ncbi:MAG TPA: hypothetical protein P5136_02630 [Methanofastidiosum sp.]|nr:hypothetical protein [Methanofastidiosum sp.]